MLFFIFQVQFTTHSWFLLNIICLQFIYQFNQGKSSVYFQFKLGIFERNMDKYFLDSFHWSEIVLSCSDSLLYHGLWLEMCVFVCVHLIAMLLGLWFKNLLCVSFLYM